MSTSKIDLYRNFAASVYQSLYAGDTVRHVGIFDPVLLTVALIKPCL